MENKTTTWFGVEIIDCENGYIVLEGNSLGTNNPYQFDRKKWVAQDPSDLAQLIQDLALDKMRDPHDQCPK